MFVRELLLIASESKKGWKKMRELEDGGKIFIRVTGNRYSVEHIAPNGVVADEVKCDDIYEAKAVFAEHPANW